jgi:acyl dehydratase
MALDSARLVGLPPRIIEHTFTRRDTMLYALGIGAANDGYAEDLQFAYEDDLQALPTMAVVLSYPGFWQREPEYGINWKQVLHVEQSVLLHQPLPVEGKVRGEQTIDAIVDKGIEKGALLYTTRKVFNVENGALLASVRQVSLLRGDGGCGSCGSVSSESYQVPDRKADFSLSFATRPEQALIYRLSGDYNPLHVDPKVAADAGLPRPILHGLCTYGFAGRAVLAAICSNKPACLKRLDCRFSAPVFPGERLEFLIWREAAGQAAFQARVPERNQLVLSSGYVEFDA